jgi:hypothetical protein
MSARDSMKRNKGNKRTGDRHVKTTVTYSSSSSSSSSSVMPALLPAPPTAGLPATTASVAAPFELKLHRLEPDVELGGTDAFMAIIDELLKEYIANGSKDGFYCNRVQLLDEFMRQNMYIIQDDRLDPYSNSFDKSYLVRLGGKASNESWTPAGFRYLGFQCPVAFVTFDANRPLNAIVWVRADQRGNGYGKFMVNELEINHVYAIEKSVPFWQHLGFTFVKPYDSGAEMKRDL